MKGSVGIAQWPEVQTWFGFRPRQVWGLDLARFPGFDLSFDQPQAAFYFLEPDTSASLEMCARAGVL